MALTMNLQNLQQENGTLLVTKIMVNMVKEMKMILPFRKVIKPNLCDYSDAYIFVTGDIKVTDVAADNNVALTVCFYHVTYAFQSESTLYSCLNVKELLARSRREI